MLTNINVEYFHISVVNLSGYVDISLLAPIWFLLVDVAEVKFATIT
jgi:hypothetical protein